MLVEVTSGDCIDVTRAVIRDVADEMGLGAVEARSRILKRSVSSPAGAAEVCAHQGLLLPIATFTVSVDREDRTDVGVPYVCEIEYTTKVDHLDTRERCVDAFERPAG